MKTIRQNYLIDAPVKRVWRALVDPSEIERWGGGQAEMDDKEGTKFRLWGGEIHGTNTKVVENKELSQDWYGGRNWTAPSKVNFKLIPKGEKTDVELIHENIPDQDVEAIRDGWEKHYLGPLRSYIQKSA